MQDSDQKTPKKDSKEPLRKVKNLKKGTHIFYEGEKGDKAYLIQAGEVEIFTGKESEKTFLGILGPGEIIGEMALFGEGHRSANVAARTNISLIEITKSLLEKKLENSDVTIRAIVKMMAERLNERNKVWGPSVTSVDHLDKAIHKLCVDFSENLTREEAKRFTKEVAPLLQELYARALKYKKS